MQRDNQTFIGIRLDPLLLDAVDKKRLRKRQSRSEFVREAIYEFVNEPGLSRDLIYPQDRVGKSKGGRPRKPAIASVQETTMGKKTKKTA